MQPAIEEVRRSILHAKRNGVSKDALVASEKLAETYFAAHKAAYGTAALKPKTHWLWDCIGQMRRDSRILDCFVIERLHLRVKRAAEHVVNTITFERTAVARALQAHEMTLQKEDACVHSGLDMVVGAFHGIRFSVEGRYMSRRFRRGDFVFVDSKASAGLVVACAATADEYLVFLDMYACHGQPTLHSMKWRPNLQKRWQPVLMGRNAFHGTHDVSRAWAQK